MAMAMPTPGRRLAIAVPMPLIRESQYLMMLLRGKNATRGTDSEREQASIRKVRRSLVDSFTEQREVAVERSVVERPQFHMDRGGIGRDGARELEKRKQTPPSRMSVRSWKILVPHPHRQIRQCYFTHCHYLVLAVIQLIHGSLFRFEIFQCSEHISLFFTVVFLFAKLLIALLIGPPFFGTYLL